MWVETADKGKKLAKSTNMRLGPLLRRPTFAHGVVYATNTGGGSLNSIPKLEGHQRNHLLFRASSHRV